MAFFYVKSGGTATGDAGRVTTARTGSFTAMGASAYYGSIEDCFSATTPCTNGDTIYCSHSHLHSTNNSYLWNNLEGNNRITEIISVDDSNCDQYRRGASETTTGTNDFNFNGRFAIAGMEFSCNDEIRQSTSNSSVIFVDCALTLTGTSDRIYWANDGTTMEFIDCDIDLGGGTFSINNGGKMYMRGGTLTSDGELFSLAFVNGGGCAILDGVDLNDVDTELLGDKGADRTEDDLIDVRFYNCRLNASVTYNNETLANRNHKIQVIGCGSSSAEAEYQYYYSSHGCTVEDEITIYRDETNAFPSGQKTSLKVVTGSELTVGNLFHFTYPSQWIEFANNESDVIKIHFASTTALDDAEVWADITYNDDANYHEKIYLTNRASDIFNGTTHTTDASSDWRNGVSALSGYNEYEMTLDTSVDKDVYGSDCVPIIRLYFGVPSATIYVCPTIGLS